MKKTLTSMLIGLFILSLSGCGSLMIHEAQSPYDFDTTVDTVMKNTQSEGWSVPKVYDFRKILLAKGGDDVGNIKVLKLCNAEMAGAMLAEDDSKFVGAMMPCSISIYEKADGHTYVSYMRMGLMSHFFDGNVGATMQKVADADARILAFLDTRG